MAAERPGPAAVLMARVVAAHRELRQSGLVAQFVATTSSWSTSAD
ncbi:hypothetical protein [Streptomyces acidicola]|nr:hypothetical protein [Streptomyces acidicola]